MLPSISPITKSLPITKPPGSASNGHGRTHNAPGDGGDNFHPVSINLWDLGQGHNQQPLLRFELRCSALCRSRPKASTRHVRTLLDDQQKSGTPGIAFCLDTPISHSPKRPLMTSKTLVSENSPGRYWSGGRPEKKMLEVGITLTRRLPAKAKAPFDQIYYSSRTKVLMDFVSLLLWPIDPINNNIP